MILNHQDAVEFPVGEADAIGFNRDTIPNFHAMLEDPFEHESLIIPVRSVDSRHPNKDRKDNR